MMALGMSFSGSLIEPAKVQMTSNPMKLNRMTERFEIALVLARSGRKVAGDMSFAKPLSAANHMPRHPTTTAMPTLSTAPPLRIQAESETFEKDIAMTTHTKASSTSILPTRPNSQPNTMPKMSGNSVAQEAIQRGKLIQ